MALEVPLPAEGGGAFHEHTLDLVRPADELAADGEKCRDGARDVRRAMLVPLSSM
jgi:hypothetical protein